MSKPDKPSGLSALIRYGLVGTAQNGVCFLIGVGLVWAGLKGWQATLLTYPLGLLLSFALNKVWSFRGREQPRGQVSRFVLLYIAVYVLATVSVWGLEQAGTPPWAAIFLVMCAAALVLFLLVNWWVFPKKRAA